MTVINGSNSSKTIRFLLENSILLIVGTIVALVWANMDSQSYDHLLNASFWPGDHGSSLSSSEHGVSLYFLINDVLMAFFFAIATKEIRESFLPGGALSSPRKAATPLLATLGGIIGPAVLYSIGVLIFSRWETLGRGWAIPCATDIAFSYMFAKKIFGPGHPAIAFLLLLAIADDAAGLAILAIFYPTGQLQLQWLLLSGVGILLGIIFHHRFRLHSFWWYLLIPGTLSWLGFYWGGIHPALGLVPIIPTLPHAQTDVGLYAREELNRHDSLNEFEHRWKNPVQVILGLFGLANAGVVFSSVGIGTSIVVSALAVGKPLGIFLFTWLGVKAFGLKLSEGMNYRHVITLGCVAGIGFTVALFVSAAAFPPSPVLSAVKMGALLSLIAGPIAIVVAHFLGIKPGK